MEEGIKNRIIIILSILVVIFFISTISAKINVRRLNKALQNKSDALFESDKKLDLVLKEKATLEEEKKSLLAQLEANSKEFEQIKKDLQVERLMTKALKDELEKMTRLKEKLEEDLKEALMIKPKSK